MDFINYRDSFIRFSWHPKTCNTSNSHENASGTTESIFWLDPWLDLRPTPHWKPAGFKLKRRVQTRWSWTLEKFSLEEWSQIASILHCRRLHMVWNAGMPIILTHYLIFHFIDWIYCQYGIELIAHRHFLLSFFFTHISYISASDCIHKWVYEPVCVCGCIHAVCARRLSAVAPKGLGRKEFMQLLNRIRWENTNAGLLTLCTWKKRSPFTF